MRVETNTRRVFVALKNIIRSSFLKPNNMLSSFFFFKVFLGLLTVFVFAFLSFWFEKLKLGSFKWSLHCFSNKDSRDSKIRIFFFLCEPETMQAIWHVLVLSQIVYTYLYIFVFQFMTLKNIL